MNNFIINVKKNSIYIISILLLLLIMSQCSKARYKNLSTRYLLESNAKYDSVKLELKLLLDERVDKILLLEKEYDSSDSSLFSLKVKLNEPK